MSANKSLALVICLAVTGCAQNPQNAEGGHWWSFGSDDAAPAAAAAPAPAPATKDVAKDSAKPAAPAKDAKAPAVASKDAAKAPAAAAPASAPAPVAAAPEAAKADSGSSWWPFGSSDKDSDAAAKAAKKDQDKPQPLAEAVAAATAPAPASESKWWWPFGGSDKAKDAGQPKAKALPMPDPKVTQAWLDDYEPRLRTAIKDSKLTLERRENLLAIIVPVDGAYNPKRPEMLLPVTLGPFTRIAKTVEGDPKTAVLVLGHGDTSSAPQPTQELSQKRAQSVAAIFRLSGLQRDRLILRGMGSVMPRAANDSTDGRALNRRIEILLTPQNTMVALLSQYGAPPVVAAPLVAVQDTKPAAAAAAAKKTTAAAKKPAAKKAAAKAPAKKAAAKPAAKKAAPAKKADDAKN